MTSTARVELCRATGCWRIADEAVLFRWGLDQHQTVRRVPLCDHCSQGYRDRLRAAPQVRIIGLVDVDEPVDARVVI
jgi:hypothetical protein